MNRYHLHICIMLALFAACHQEAPIAMGCVEVLVADTCDAGSVLQMRVRSSERSRGAAFILIDNGHGIEVIKVKMSIDTLIKRKFIVSGIVKIGSFVNRNLCNSKQVYIKPLSPVHLPGVYLGPKAVNTGGQDSTMITVIPGDVFGNLLQDTTMVHFSVIHPDGSILTGKDSLHGGIASLYIGSRQVSGKGFASATIGAISTKQMDFLEVSTNPVDFKIYAAVHSSFADGRQTFKIITEILLDRYGNLLPEGSIVYFTCLEASGTLRTITGYTIGGVATVYLQNPACPGILKVNASTTTGAGSNTLELIFSTPKFEN